MSNIAAAIRWGIALIAAVVAYLVVIMIVPMLERNVSAISPSVLILNSTLLASAAGVGLGAVLAPRAHIRLARITLFWIAMLVPLGNAAWAVTHGHAITMNYLLMLAGAFAGGMLGVFIGIMPKPPRPARPRRFG